MTRILSEVDRGLSCVESQPVPELVCFVRGRPTPRDEIDRSNRDCLERNLSPPVLTPMPKRPMLRRLTPSATGSTVLNEGSVLQFRHRFTQLLLSIHYDRPIPGHRLLDWLTGDQQESNSFGPRLHRQFVSAVEQH